MEDILKFENIDFCGYIYNIKYKNERVYVYYFDKNNIKKTIIFKQYKVIDFKITSMYNLLYIKNLCIRYKIKYLIKYHKLILHDVCKLQKVLDLENKFKKNKILYEYLYPTYLKYNNYIYIDTANNICEYRKLNSKLFNICSLDIEYITYDVNDEWFLTKEHKIICVSLLISIKNKIKKYIYYNFSDEYINTNSNDIKYIKCNSDKDIIEKIIDKFNKIDIDILIGYYIKNSDLLILNEYVKKYISNHETFEEKVNDDLIIFDLYKHIRIMYNFSSYKLTYCYNKICNKSEKNNDKIKCKINTILKSIYDSETILTEYISYINEMLYMCYEDTKYVLEIFLKLKILEKTSINKKYGISCNTMLCNI